MDGGASPFLYPLHRCKTIHLALWSYETIHPGEAWARTRNVEGDKNYKTYLSPEYFDAQLTELGWQQVDNLRARVLHSGPSKRMDLVIASL